MPDASDPRIDLGQFDDRMRVFATDHDLWPLRPEDYPRRPRR